MPSKERFVRSEFQIVASKLSPLVALRVEYRDDNIWSASCGTGKSIYSYGESLSVEMKMLRMRIEKKIAHEVTQLLLFETFIQLFQDNVMLRIQIFA